jgi:hypothetical protein
MAHCHSSIHFLNIFENIKNLTGGPTCHGFPIYRKIKENKKKSHLARSHRSQPPVVDHGRPAAVENSAAVPGHPWTRGLARWDRADAGDHMVAAPLRIGGRSLAAGEQLWRPGRVAHGGGARGG